MKTLAISIFILVTGVSFSQSKVSFFKRVNSSRMVERGIEQYNFGGTSDAYMTFN
jgi:hypothetical protein